MSRNNCDGHIIFIKKINNTTITLDNTTRLTFLMMSITHYFANNMVNDITFFVKMDRELGFTSSKRSWFIVMEEKNFWFHN